MPKEQLKAWLPTPEQLRRNKIVRLFAPFLTDPKLWHMNRGSMVRAVYVGVVCAFFPLPGQMALAILGAFFMRANVPMSVALTWITNPLTAIPVFWAAYYLGATILGEPTIGLRTIGIILTELTLWLFGEGENPFVVHRFFSIKAFFLGTGISALIASTILGLGFDLFWRYRIAKTWRQRKGYQPDAPSFSSQKKKNPPNPPKE